jgi:hypothetical protein
MSTDTPRTLKDALTEAIQAALHNVRGMGDGNADLKRSLNYALDDLYGHKDIAPERLPELRLLLNSAYTTLHGLAEAKGAVMLIDGAIDALEKATTRSYGGSKANIVAVDEAQYAPEIKPGTPGQPYDERTHAAELEYRGAEDFKSYIDRVRAANREGAKPISGAPPPTRRELAYALLLEAGALSRSQAADEKIERALESVAAIVAELDKELDIAVEDARRRRSNLEQVLTYTHRRLSAHAPGDSTTLLQFILRLAAGLTTLQSPPTGAEVGAALYEATELAHSPQEADVEERTPDAMLALGLALVNELQEALTGQKYAGGLSEEDIAGRFAGLRNLIKDLAGGTAAVVADGLDHIPGSILEELEESIRNLGDVAVVKVPDIYAEWRDDNLERLRILRGCFAAYAKRPETEGRLGDGAEMYPLSLFNTLEHNIETGQPGGDEGEAWRLDSLEAIRILKDKFIRGDFAGAPERLADLPASVRYSRLDLIRDYCKDRLRDYEGRQGMINLTSFRSYLIDIQALTVGEKSRAVPRFDFEDSTANIRAIGEEIKRDRKRAVDDAGKLPETVVNAITEAVRFIDELLPMLNKSREQGQVVVTALMRQLEYSNNGDFLGTPPPDIKHNIPGGVIFGGKDGAYYVIDPAQPLPPDFTPDKVPAISWTQAGMMADKLREWTELDRFTQRAAEDIRRTAGRMIGDIETILKDCKGEDAEDGRLLTLADNAIGWLRAYFGSPEGAPLDPTALSSQGIPPAVLDRIRTRIERAITEHLAAPFKSGAKDRLLAALKDASSALKDAADGSPRILRLEITEGTYNLLTVSAIETINTLHAALWTCEAERNIYASLGMLGKIRHIVLALDKAAAERADLELRIGDLTRDLRRSNKVRETVVKENNKLRAKTTIAGYERLIDKLEKVEEARDKLQEQLEVAENEAHRAQMDYSDLSARQVTTNQLYHKQDEERIATISALRQDNELLSRENELQGQSIVAYMFVVQRLRGCLRAFLDLYKAQVKAVNQVEDGKYGSVRPDKAHLTPEQYALDLIYEIKALAESARTMGEEELQLLDKACPSFKMKTTEGLTEY